MNRLSQPRWILLVGSLLMIVITLVMVYRINQDGLLPMDLEFTRAVQSIQVPGFEFLMTMVSIPGRMPWSTVIVLLAGLIVGLWFSVRLGIYLLAISALQFLLNWSIKTAVERPRPTEPPVRVLFPDSGYSFPSGHVMFYTIVFGLLVYLVFRYMASSGKKTVLVVLLFSMVLLVGLSRVYLGAHWLSDVIAGYLIGLVFLGWSLEIFVLWFRRVYEPGS